MKVYQPSFVPFKAPWTLKPTLIHRPGLAVGVGGLVTGLLLTGLAAPAVAPVLPPPVEAAVYQAPLWNAIASLAVTDEDNRGYNRDRYFGDWADADGDCQNTRHEVLAEETHVPPTYRSGGCEVSAGRWVTSWDNRVHPSASTLQIDHTVPVHEAWGSGAKYWSQARRVAFLNDLGDPRSLTAQTTALNKDKNGQGPQNWMPPANRCAYITDWVAVKIRWGLSIDFGEKDAIVNHAKPCPNVLVTVTRA